MMEDDKRQIGLEKKPSMPKISRKKFAKPPVKVACLSCRASRIRCDGKDPCSSCALKGKDCSYLPSKRGGPRRKRISQPGAMTAEKQNRLWTAIHPIPPIDEGMPPEILPVPFRPMSQNTVDTNMKGSEIFNQVDTLAVPGAGLRHLDFPVEVQSMFEGLFVPPSTEQPHSGLDSEPVSVDISPPPLKEPTRVRVYGSEQEILNGYFIYIHNYFPIFPPPHTPIAVDRPLDMSATSSDEDSTDPTLVYHPKSPVTLAMSAILALVPHPRDLEPSSAKSVLLRRSYSHKFARAAVDSVETETDLTESAASPAQALLNENMAPDRMGVHPHTPVELESILALLLLSIYEYTQRGNLAKMRHRAGQAYVMAMSMSLHATGPREDVFSEAKRRAWWMTYYCVCQGSIVSTTPPTIITNDSRFTTPYPQFASDSAAWTVLIQSQQALVAGTQYVIDLNRALGAKVNMTRLFERMKKLHAWTGVVLAQANSPPSGSHPQDCEAVTAQSIRCMSRIKLCSARIKTHRFRAFLDIPIFIKKHCDLTCASAGGSADVESSTNESESQSTAKPSCCGGSLSQLPVPPNPTGSSPSSTPSPSDVSVSPWLSESSFPFTIQESTTTCLESALTIAQMFDSLPYPNPTYGENIDSQNPHPPLELTPMPPRTMPSFACCAMQSSYAMLMLYYKSRVMKQEVDDSPFSDPDQLADQLQHGLECVIAAVRNYSTAFEALDGMRDEIEGAFLTAFS